MVSIIYSMFVYTIVGVETDPDKFPIGWHPHRGMDILTYMVEGQLDVDISDGLFYSSQSLKILYYIHTYTCRSRPPCRFVGEQGDIRIPWNAVDQRG